LILLYSYFSLIFNIHPLPHPLGIELILLLHLLLIQWRQWQSINAQQCLIWPLGTQHRVFWAFRQALFSQNYREKK
jgi:hypothetical protein